MPVDAASVEADSLEVLRACREWTLATIAVLGDVPVGSIAYDDVARFRDVMLKLSKRRSTDKRYKSLSLKEMMALNIPPEERIAGRNVKEDREVHSHSWQTGSPSP